MEDGFEDAFAFEFDDDDAAAGSIVRASTDAPGPKGSGKGDKGSKGQPKDPWQQIKDKCTLGAKAIAAMQVRYNGLWGMETSQGKGFQGFMYESLGTDIESESF